jgi:hypothetical protein
MEFRKIKSGSDGDLAFNIGSFSMDQPSDGGTTKVRGKYLDAKRPAHARCDSEKLYANTIT